MDELEDQWEKGECGRRVMMCDEDAQDLTLHARHPMCPTPTVW